MRNNFSCPNFICPLTKNTHASPINYFGPSQILPTYYPTWVHTNTSHTITKIGSQNYTISIKAQNSSILWAKPKKSNKTLYKTHCYTTLFIKPIATQDSLQSPLQRQLLYSTLTKPVANGNIFHKISKYLQKAQMLFWQHFTKKPNTILTTFTKSLILF